MSSIYNIYMGVPGFFLWLMKNYKKKGFVFQKEKLTNTDINSLKNISNEMIEKILLTNKFNQENLNKINNIDYFLIDANCLIHPVCFKVIADNPYIVNTNRLEDKMINSVIEYLEKLISYVDPKKGVYLAIDGVAPIAKVKQQRSRRFKSVADKVLWNNVKKKYNLPTSHPWNNSAITPGTLFMDKLHSRILFWAKNHVKTIIYSSCFTPAEGEHKLLQFIRTHENPNLSYIVYGLDADLIFLALSTEIDDIFLLREATEFNKYESKEVLNYVSIMIMRESIVSTIKEYLLKENKLYGFNNLDEKRIVNDFIFMCYFLGNDFLPHIPSLDIHNDGIESIIVTYAKVMNKLLLENNKIEYLLSDKIKLQGKSKNKINNNFLLNFISILGLQEESILKNNFIKGKKRIYCDGDEYKKEISKIENLQFKIIDPIQLGSDNSIMWRKRYYKHYWDITNEDELEKFSENLVKHYLIGIKWVTLYYFDKCPSWGWYYPFEQPPFISDIAKYLSKINLNKVNFAIDEPLKPYMQLLAVLPPQSNYLVPLVLRELMITPNSPLACLYPTEFEQDFINKNKYWMGIPKLPPLNIELIRETFNKYINKLSKIEIDKNEIKDVFILDP